MKVTPTDIADVLILEPRCLEMREAFFYKLQRKAFEEATGFKDRFVQDNRSSKRAC
jgi:dTDP-4-dehydrorhamnose 3,5-epimerase